MLQQQNITLHPVPSTSARTQTSFSQDKNRRLVSRSRLTNAAEDSGAISTAKRNNKVTTSDRQNAVNKATSQGRKPSRAVKTVTTLQQATAVGGTHGSLVTRGRSAIVAKELVAPSKAKANVNVSKSGTQNVAVVHKQTAHSTKSSVSYTVTERRVTRVQPAKEAKAKKESAAHTVAKEKRH
jgi:hypothetical protein